VAEHRYKAVLAVIADGRTVTEVARDWGVSRQTMHAWLARYEAEGLEGLSNRSHRPAHCPHQIPAGVEAQLLEMREPSPSGEHVDWRWSWPARRYNRHLLSRRSTARWLRQSELGRTALQGPRGHSARTHAEVRGSSPRRPTSTQRAFHNEKPQPKHTASSGFCLSHIYPEISPRPNDSA
jgi:leucine-zipper of insertion element IS481